MSTVTPGKDFFSPHNIPPEELANWKSNVKFEVDVYLRFFLTKATLGSFGDIFHIAK